MSTPPVTFAPLGALARPVTTPIDLARRAAGGNTVATGRLVRSVTPKVCAAVRAVLGAAHPDVDDAVQLALLAFVRALPDFRGDCEPVGFARGIAVRTAIAARKRARRSSARMTTAELDGLTAADPTPGEHAAAHARRELVRDLIAELPEEQGETLALRVGLGWSIEEIAVETGAPINTVRSRLRLAKTRLRERIDGDPARREMLRSSGAAGDDA